MGLRGRVKERENLNSKTLFYKDCRRKERETEERETGLRNSESEESGRRKRGVGETEGWERESRISDQAEGG